MVQSYLKKVGHRTFTANKKGRNREFFPHFPSPFAFLIATTKNCHVGIAISTHGLKESKQLFEDNFSVSDDADFIPPAIENRASIVHCPLSVQIACKIEYQKDDFRIILTNPDFAIVNMHFLTMADGDGGWPFMSLIIKL